MIAKGLDLKCDFVGVINADISLNIPDFRANERTFQLLEQVSGRSGRGKKQGTVMIQTYNPDHFVLQCVKNHDYQSFYQKEMEMRKLAKYPPYCYLISILVQGKKEDDVTFCSQQIKEYLVKQLPKAIVLGPANCTIYKMNDIYRKRMTLKITNTTHVYEVLHAMSDYYNKKGRKVQAMLPTREEALKLIRDGLLFNPGPWGKHCLTAAHCAEKIASACGDMDVEKAYILGLLHDIGRKFGVRHLGHVYDGYVYMKSLGYDEVAKICLTHSFNNHTIDEYIGKFDVTDEELTIIKTELAKTIYDEYDRLIQLCDCLAGAEGVLDIENRMNDVKKRYGFYPQDKWNSNMNLKQYFEGKMNKDIYLICEKDTFAPGDL